MSRRVLKRNSWVGVVRCSASDRPCRLVTPRPISSSLSQSLYPPNSVLALVTPPAFTILHNTSTLPSSDITDRIPAPQICQSIIWHVKFWDNDQKWEMVSARLYLNSVDIFAQLLQGTFFVTLISKRSHSPFNLISVSDLSRAAKYPNSLEGPGTMIRWNQTRLKWANHSLQTSQTIFLYQLKILGSHTELLTFHVIFWLKMVWIEA